MRKFQVTLNINRVEQYVPKEYSGVAIDSKPTSVFPGREAE